VGKPVIRTYREEDEEQIVALTQVAWAGATVWQTIEARYGPRGGKPWWEHKLHPILECARTRQECFLVAEWEGQIAGYATFSLDPESRIGTVGNNAVHPDLRGRGIGSALHEAVLRRIVDAGMEMIQVTTTEPLTNAQRMYERHGFQELIRSITYAMRANEAKISGDG